MRAALLAFVASSATAYYQPGDPPQCFDDYQCIFSRFNLTGLKAQYVWDVRNLCLGPGSEYVVGRNPTCVVDQTTGTCPPQCFGDCGDQTPRIRFNVCGTVSGPVAPVKEENCPNPDPQNPGCPNGVGSAQEIPIPASHGVAVQVRLSAWPSPHSLSPCSAPRVYQYAPIYTTAPFHTTRSTLRATPAQRLLLAMALHQCLARALAAQTLTRATRTTTPHACPDR